MALLSQALAIGALSFLVAAAGCLEVAPMPVEPDPEALPPPRDVHPDSLQGLDAAMDSTGRVPVSPWSQECVRQWTSGSYVYDDPPIVGGRPCLFYPTSDGTLYWHLAHNTGDIRHGVPAAPIPRSDGFFDWFVFDQQDYLGHGGVVRFFENGSFNPTYEWPDFGVGLMDPPSAVRIGNTIHLLLYSSPPPLLPQPSPSPSRAFEMHHYWVGEDREPRHEVLLLGNFFPEYTWRNDTVKAYAIGTHVGNMVSETLFVTDGGALTALPPVVGTLFDVVVVDGVPHACVASGAQYLHAWLANQEPTTLWQYEEIAVSSTAQVSFTCDITMTAEGLVVVVDVPAALGGGPNPLAGSEAFTRNDDGTWTRSAIGFQFHSGDDLATVRGIPYHMGQTGNGTSNVDPKCGYELRRPVLEDPRGDWHVVHCNHQGDWAYLLDTDTTPVIVASAMLNPPFQSWGSLPGTTMRMTSVVLALPPLPQSAVPAQP